MTNVTIPSSVTNIGDQAFANCSGLTSVFFQGNAPGVVGAFADDGNDVTLYYSPGTTGWSNTLDGVPTVLWNPLIQTSGASFGISNNQFGFNVTGTTNIPILVKACTNLANSVWTPRTNVMLTNGLFYFSEPLQTNIPGRYYRIRHGTKVC